MRPGTRYDDLVSEGVTWNTLYRVGVEVDGRAFVVRAKSEKLARKYAAIEACNQLFGTTFAKD